MEHLDKNIVTRKEKKVYHTDFASAFYFLAFISLIVYILASLNTLLTPIAIAFLIWFLINAFATTIRKIPFLDGKVGKNIAIPLSLVIIMFTFFQVGTFITSSIVELSSTIAGLDSKFKGVLIELSNTLGVDIKSQLKTIFEQFSIAGIINKIIGAFSSIVSNIMQILLYVLFLLLDQRFFNIKINALFKDREDRDNAKNVLHKISVGISTYLYITTLVSATTGILTYFVCEAFGLDGAVLWGFVAFILNFIPTIGSIIAVLVPSIFGFVQFTDMTHAILLIPALAVIQFLIGNIIQPRLMGDKLNISQFVVILSLVIWGMMWGTVGMFLSVPLMVILLIIFSQFENTKAMAVLISGNGKIANGN